MYDRKTFADLQVGQQDKIRKQITEDVVKTFADVSEDFNPVHFDEKYAKTTIFGRRIAHGMICAGLISAVLGTKLPGVGTIYLGQELRFKAPVFLGDTVTAKVEIVELDPAKKRVKLATSCETQDGKIVADGFALVMLNQ